METSKISIAFASDLHLPPFYSNRRDDALYFPPEADVIILAGDIAVGNLAAEEALNLAERYPNSHVVQIAGNHEFYYKSIEQQIEYYRSACADHDRVHFLENACVELFGVRFIGCTLWTDFTILGEPEIAMQEAEAAIADFRFIESRVGASIKPKDIARKFEESYRFLDDQLAAGDPDRTVVITHFPPGMRTSNPNFEVDPITAYFQANVDYLIENYQPKIWVYGHNHYSADQTVGRTRIVSNQLGYPSEFGRIPAYDPQKMIILETGADHDVEL